MLHEERQEVSRCRTLLAYDIDLNINDASVLGEVEFVCFNCICLSSVPNWTKRIRIPEEKFFSTKIKFSRPHFLFKKLLREL